MIYRILIKESTYNMIITLSDGVLFYCTYMIPLQSRNSKMLTVTLTVTNVILDNMGV